jgi:NADPH:quinone reductase-like Zn-dependent oxidoreductase
MQAFRIHPGKGISSLERVERPRPKLSARDVLVRIHAVSLNFRDLMVADGSYPVASDKPPIGCADGAGEIIAVGPEVTRFKVGDRVMSTYFPRWLDGAPTEQNTALVPGANLDGMLAEEVALSEDAWVAMPSHLDFAEASTLPCAGVTAWNALFIEGGVKPGGTVLLLGTGGVSILALQLAKAAGLRAIITSSSDAKLERARALGADATINYHTTPNWQDEVAKLTNGAGADAVLEVGGNTTLKPSITATKMGGVICIIGGVSGFSSEIEIAPVLVGAKRLIGIFVGNRTMSEALARFVEASRIRPVIDRVFSFNEALAAHDYLQKGQHFGKVVIRVAE